MWGGGSRGEVLEMKSLSDIIHYSTEILEIFL